ncbi:hypothetical protein MOQ_000820, partial [Trypanosoma cruzi marinkellei]
MKWRVLKEIEGRGKLGCPCDEYWLRFTVEHEFFWRVEIPPLLSHCLCVAVGAAPILFCVCVPSVRGADTTDRSRRMYMWWSLVCRSCLLLPPPSVCWCCGRAVFVCVVCGVCCCRWWHLLLCRVFLLFCVDGLLVCAEGYTQVTGVMAMMMTGRVLLVCALCVLWCGASQASTAERDDKVGQSTGGVIGAGHTLSSEESQSNPSGEAPKPDAAPRRSESQHSSGGGAAGKQGQGLEGTASGRPNEVQGEVLKQLGEGRTPQLSPTAAIATIGPPTPLPAKSSPPQLPSSSPSAQTLSSGADILQKPATDGDSESSGTTTEPQPANNSQPQSQLMAGGTETEAAALTGAPPAEGKAASPEENDLGKSEVAAGEQELNQTDGRETQTTTKATVNAAP